MHSPAASSVVCWTEGILFCSGNCTLACLLKKKMTSALIYTPPGESNLSARQEGFFPPDLTWGKQISISEDEMLGIFFLGGSSNFWFVATLIWGWRKYFGTENLPKCCLTGNCSLISTYETLTIIVFNLATQDKVWFRISWLVLWKKKKKKETLLCGLVNMCR